MAEDLDRMGAEALGWEIVPWGTDSERPCIWEGEDGTLFARRFKVACESGCDCCTEPFRPSTDAGDAIAALEEFSKAHNAVPHWGYFPNIEHHYSGRIVTTKGGLGVQAETFCEWCCQAILSLEAAP